MPDITVVPRDPHFASAFDEAYRSQLPFAAAVALTRVGWDGARMVRKRTKEHWNVRQRGLPKLVKGLKARKKDWPNLTGGVFVEQEVGRVYREHEEGAVRKPRGKTIVVPSRNFAAFRLKSGRMRKGKDPRSLIESGKAKLTDRAIVLKKVRKKDRRAIAYFRVEEARIKPGLRASETVGFSIAKSYQRHFEIEMKAAIKSRRAQPGRFSSQLGKDLYVIARRQYGRIPGF